MPKQNNKLDLAARAAWLYYVSGNTQEEIAAKLQLSRPGAQRLIALAMEEGFVKVRINHPIPAPPAAGLVFGLPPGAFLASANHLN